MKNILLYIASLLLILSTSACSSVVISNESYNMAIQGQTVLKYEGFNCSYETLKSATLLALEDRGWIVTNSNNPIQARITRLRVDARLSIQIKQNALWFETKGSLVDGNKAFVPIDYVNNLMLSIRKNVQIMTR